ncbi:unnamed protein product [Victoria cruziana]
MPISVLHEPSALCRICSAEGRRAGRYGVDPPHY